MFAEGFCKKPLFCAFTKKYLKKFGLVVRPGEEIAVNGAQVSVPLHIPDSQLVDVLVPKFALLRGLHFKVHSEQLTVEGVKTLHAGSEAEIAKPGH